MAYRSAAAVAQLVASAAVFTMLSMPLAPTTYAAAPDRHGATVKTSCASKSAVEPKDWLTYGGDGTHSGVGIAPAPSAGVLYEEWTTPPLDGALYAEPVILDGCVVVATENDTVYGFDGFSGQLRWRDHLGAPVPAADVPCGDISPSGITGTPVADQHDGTIWVADFAKVGAGIQHQLVEISVANGGTVTRRVLSLPHLAPQVEQQRGALSLAGGKVYVPFGGLFGSCGKYRGVVVAVPSTRAGKDAYWYAPAVRGGGIWAPGGADVLADDNLLFATGDGEYESPRQWAQQGAVVRLSSHLQVTAEFSPKSDAVREARPAPDLASTSPAVLHGGLVFQVGTDGTGWLLSSAAPGSRGSLHEVRALKVCRSGGAFASDAVYGDVVYVPCQAGLTAVRVSSTGAAVLWRSSGVGPGAPVVDGGKVWVVTTTGLLEGIDLATGIAVQHMQLALPETHFPWLIADGETMYAIDGRRVMDLTGL